MPPLNPKPEAHQRHLIRPIGLCLSGLGLLGSTAVQAQTNGVEASRLLKADGISEVQAPAEVTPSPASAPIATPETLQVPSASVTAEPQPPIAVEPIQPSAKPSPASQAPDAIVISDRTEGCETTMKWGGVTNLCKGEAPAATVAQPQPAPRPTYSRQAAAPEVEAVPEAVEVEAAADPNAINLGPVSVSRSGIQFTPPQALKPYFNGNLKFAKMPNLGDLKMIFPIAIPSPISSLFGWRTHPISGEHRMHTGTDIAAPMGTPVVAAMAGRVLLADFLGGYGITIALEHAEGTTQTLYAHLSELFVKPGDIVPQGAVIGRVGSSGNSTGPHLHFELRQQLPDGSWVARDSGKELELAMGQLVTALQVAKNPQAPLAVRPAQAPQTLIPGQAIPQPKLQFKTSAQPSAPVQKTIAPTNLQKPVIQNKAAKVAPAKVIANQVIANQVLSPAPVTQNRIPAAPKAASSLKFAPGR